MHRSQDGYIHVMLSGTHLYNLGSEWPGGGSTKKYGPPIIWEIEPKTGKTSYIYNLSDYGDVFYSSLRYTPNGNLAVAVCTYNEASDIKILIIDQMTHQVIYQHTSGIEPMLLQTTNNEPAV